MLPRIVNNLNLICSALLIASCRPVTIAPPPAHVASPTVAAIDDATTIAAVPPNFESATADLGDVKIHYLAGGRGPTLLLIHGWPETWYEWRKMMPGLAEHFSVIAVDLRGMGASSLEPAGYDKKTLASDLHRLLKSLQRSSAIVVGHDWGGPVAYAYAAQFRKDVDKLILIEGAPFGPWLKSLEPFWFFHLLRLPDRYAEDLITGHESQFLSYFYRNEEFHVVPAFDDATINVYVRAYARPGRMAPSYALYRTIDEDVRDNAEFAAVPLEVPVLAVGARRGAGQFAIDGAKAVAAHVTPLLFDDTGHFIPEERPGPLRVAIERFIAGQSLPNGWKASAPAF